MIDIEMSINEAETKHIKHRLRILASFRVVSNRRRSLVSIAMGGSDDGSHGRAISVMFTVSCPMETLYDDALYAVVDRRLRN